MVPVRGLDLIGSIFDFIIYSFVVHCVVVRPARMMSCMPARNIIIISR
jgi:hypothetical protein